jgi:hypothetical protein
MKHIKSFNLFEANELTNEHTTLEHLNNLGPNSNKYGNDPLVRDFMREMPSTQKAFIDLNDKEFIGLVTQLKTIDYRDFFRKVSRYKTFSELKNALRDYVHPQPRSPFIINK